MIKNRKLQKGIKKRGESHCEISLSSQGSFSGMGLRMRK
ncbi:hypothetical protein DSOL_3326 [Desulfosporosinus metallidurans]|uniref:Uncharacterized protein n=1 Tax=Desulfosporosinus metallidurans TaxID=1888891 RepID=A0A1Q8QRN9_9FIRM|nr:hypothetical protein DSOL_3326 [Desulfosporosinus metallidurans]